VIRPEGLDVAIWATRHLPSNAVYVGDEATGRELAGGGARFAFTGSANGVRQLLSDGTLPRWQRDFLVTHQIDFVVLDRRRISSDNLAAYFFQRADAPDGGYGYYPQGVRTKFERLPQDSRVTDTGNIVVYDVRGLHARPPLCSDLGPLSNAAGITCRTSTHALTVAGSDRIAELPGFRMRELATEVQPYGKGIRITVRVQVQNLSTAPYQPDAGWRHFAMYVGQTQIYRQRRVAGRTDNLDGSNPLAPGAKLEGSLSFQLDHRQAMRFVRDGGQLVIRPPHSQRLFNEEIRGVILLAGTPGKAARVDRARARQCGRSQASAAASGGGKPC
jgi:hypothetical protein